MDGVKTQIDSDIAKLKTDITTLSGKFNSSMIAGDADSSMTSASNSIKGYGDKTETVKNSVQSSYEAAKEALDVPCDESSPV